MIYPNLVYRTPGDHHCKGGTYSYLSVHSDGDVLKAFAEGWWPTIELALKQPETFKIDEYLGIEELDDDAPATRKEIESQAQKLGIAITKKMKDETILARIEEALADSEGDGA